MNYDREHTITTDDAAHIFVGEKGAIEARPVILLDGLGCAGFAWKYLQPHLAERFRVVHWNYRGHGRSAAPPTLDSMNIARFSRDLETVLKELRIDGRDTSAPAPIFVAHSLGAQVCLEYARTHGDAIGPVVLICGVFGEPTKYFRGTQLLETWVPRALEAAEENPELANLVWSLIPSKVALRFGKVFGELDAERIQDEDFATYWDHVLAMDPMVFLTLLKNAGAHNALDVVPAISDRALIIAAERDTFVPMSHSRTLAAAASEARFVVFRHASHALPVEFTEELNLEIDDFLRDQLRP